MKQAILMLYRDRLVYIDLVIRFVMSLCVWKDAKHQGRIARAVVRPSEMNHRGLLAGLHKDPLESTIT